MMNFTFLYFQTSNTRSLPQTLHISPCWQGGRSLQSHSTGNAHEWE